MTEKKITKTRELQIKQIQEIGEYLIKEAESIVGSGKAKNVITINACVADHKTPSIDIYRGVELPSLREEIDTWTVTSTPTYTVDQVAQQIVNGQGGWGDGNVRKQTVESVGLSYDAVQAKVNALLGVGTTTTPHNDCYRNGSYYEREWLYDATKHY